MTITPFLAFSLRRKKHAVLARHRARRVASLLRFDPSEQACIAAGTFVIACQAMELFARPSLYFQIENHQLDIFAEEAEPSLETPGLSASHRLAGLLPPVEPARIPYRLVKPLPTHDGAADEVDLAWLVRSIETTAGHIVFDELVKQNQEVLALLAELRLYQGRIEENGGKPANPHAA